LIESEISRVKGFTVAGVHCGLKKEGKLDFALIVSDTPCNAAGVFTTNRVKAAPVLVDIERLIHQADRIRAVAINTGCANACTGQQGIDNALQTARWVAETLGCEENEVLVMSTGVIGTQLPMDKIKQGIKLAVDSLGEKNWEATARAIMTTDTRPKMASVQSKGYQIAGIAKGAGMIAPNMATMLSVIVSDTEISQGWAHVLMREAAERTFNRIVVDGDMSTNDTVLHLTPYTRNESLPYNYEDSLRAICKKLAQDIVRDGEGVTKFITLTVQGTSDIETAHRVANTIATSPLVKTAFYGNDANWGRIMAAAGRAGVAIDPQRSKLWIAPGEETRWSSKSLLLFDTGMPTNYREEQVAEIFKNSEVSILLDCGMGGGFATVYTCDLSHEYVSINGDYRS
jgi:glutamate N-acetyltransferase / amino-acid N-acetyltransferase